MMEFSQVALMMFINLMKKVKEIGFHNSFILLLLMLVTVAPSTIPLNARILPNNLVLILMCTNMRWVHSKYSRHSFLVPCGHCEACVQQKAALMSNRIRNHALSDKTRLPLFVTLTYDRSSCPFVFMDDILRQPDALPIYREYQVRRIRRSDGNYTANRRYNLTHLDTLYFPDYSEVVKSRFEDKKFFLPYLKHRKEKIGVCYYKDVQDFFKRLKSNLVRKYHYEKGFSQFVCSEYGPKTIRPHFHFLIFIPPSDEALFREAITEAWPFARSNRTQEYIEFCREDAASYVSSYVNCGSDFPAFLADNFKPKHSHSKYFGHGLSVFSLSEILAKADKCDLRYTAEVNRGGILEKLRLPVPKYIINRFFPQFKGLSRLTGDEISFVLSHGQGYSDLQRFQANERLISFPVSTWSDVDGVQWYQRRFIKSKGTYFEQRHLDISFDDVKKTCGRLLHAFNYYHKVTGKNRFDYAIDYQRVWNAYKSSSYRSFMEDRSIHDAYKYDNIFEFFDDDSISISLKDKILSSHVKLFDDPNVFPQNVNKTAKLRHAYYLYQKTKKVNDCVRDCTDYV